MQHLVSSQGHRHILSTTGQEAGKIFFADWRKRLKKRGAHASPCIANLFYAAYEAATLIEELPEPASNPPACILWSLYPEWSLCFEHDRVHLAAENEMQLDALQQMLDNFPDDGSQVDDIQHMDLSGMRATDGQQYMQQVRQVKELIAAGDIFQANIARFWSMPFAAGNLGQLYRCLRRVNPAPFSCYVRVEGGDEDMHLLSASPERLFRITADGVVDTRPIAGTRQRGEGESDTALRDEMLLSAKERAEHIMLVDLERNDLGRVCIPGTVEVNESMAVEGYATVQHIVSNVRGRLREGLGLVDVFRAMFPGGTITGCPKVRCMQIIRELEGQARGPYTGGVGFSAWDGSADMNILIRSFWHHGDMLYWAAGAGIVADSDPDSELKETGHKAEGLMRALDVRG
jgi:anthranilate synthase component I